MFRTASSIFCGDGSQARSSSRANGIGVCGRRHHFRRRFESGESLGSDQRRNVGGQAAARRTFVDHDQPAGLLDAVEDRLPRPSGWSCEDR